MSRHRYQLRASEQRKLAAISHQEIDTMARVHARRREHEKTQQDISRQSLRDALHRA